MRRPRNRMSQNTMAEELYAVIAIGGAVIALVALVWTAVHLGASIDHLAAPAEEPGGARSSTWCGRRPRGQRPPPSSSSAEIVAAADSRPGRRRRGRRRTTARGERWSMSWQGGCPATPRPCVATPTSDMRRSPPRSARGSPSDATWSADRSSARAGRTWPPSSPARGPARPPPRWPRPSWLPPGPSTPVRTSATWWTSRQRPAGRTPTVWIFDPQGIADGHPTWWWNPLDMAGDLAGARTLAGLFAAASRPPGSATRCLLRSRGRGAAGHPVAGRSPERPAPHRRLPVAVDGTQRRGSSRLASRATNWPLRPCSTS